MLRKSIAMLLLIVMLVSLAATAAASWTGYVTSTGLYIREKASSSSKALKCPKYGAALTILEETGSWYYVKYGVVYGYVAKKFVSSANPKATSVKSSSSSSSASSSQVTTGQTSSAISETTIAQLGNPPVAMSEGSRGNDVVKLQKALKILGYFSYTCDGIYGPKTTAAVKKYQKARGLTTDGIAGNGTIRTIFGSSAGTDSGTTSTDTSSSGSGSGRVSELQWFNTGYNLINSYPNVTILDCKTGISWKGRYINGTYHADVIPASASDASKLTNNNILGSYVRRPVVVTINGAMYAGSMYCVAHGVTNYCDYFDGVLCIHFTGSKTHGSANVDSDHQAAIQTALNYY